MVEAAVGGRGQGEEEEEAEEEKVVVLTVAMAVKQHTQEANGRLWLVTQLPQCVRQPPAPPRVVMCTRGMPTTWGPLGIM